MKTQSKLAESQCVGRDTSHLCSLRYQRRGYGGSSAPDGPSSIAADAADAVALLDILGVDRVHLVGVSFSAAIALQLASTVPERVHSLAVIEPPPVHVPSAAQFRAANPRLVELRRDAGVPEAQDSFLTMLVEPHWRSELDQRGQARSPRAVGELRRIVNKAPFCGQGRPFPLLPLARDAIWPDHRPAAGAPSGNDELEDGSPTAGPA